MILIKKPWKKVKNLAKGQGEDCTTGYLLRYDYIENHYRLTAVDLSKQKELDADPRSIQQIDFVEQTKKLGDDDAESMFTLTILEKKFNCISKQFNFKRNK